MRHLRVLRLQVSPGWAVLSRKNQDTNDICVMMADRHTGNTKGNWAGSRGERKKSNLDKQCELPLLLSPHWCLWDFSAHSLVHSLVYSFYLLTHQQP